jgi:antitoxin VapB
MNTAKIFKNGNSQAVRLPKEFQFDVPEVQIFTRGDEVILKKSPKNLARVFGLLTELSDDFLADGRDQPSAQEREEF